MIWYKANKLLLALACVLAFGACQGQQILQKAIKTWVSSSGTDVLVVNGGYLIYGTNNVLLRVNNNGDPLWAYRYYSQVLNDNIGNIRMQMLIETTGDTSIVMTGAGRLGNVFLIKTDIAGNLVWGLNFFDSAGMVLGTGRDIFIDNQMIYVTGRKRVNNQIDHGFISCVHSNGNIIWFKNYLFSLHTGFTSIHVSNNKLYVIGSNNNGVSAGLLMCTDLSGNVVFAKEMQGFSDDYFSDMVFNSKGEMTIVGATESYNSVSRVPLLLKMDSIGILQWCQVYNKSLDALSIMNFNDKLLINTHGHPNVLICDTTGQVINAYYTGNNISYGMRSSRPTPDSGFVSVASIDLSSSHHIYLYKTDQYGGTACNSWGYNITALPWQPSFNSITPLSVTNNTVWSDTSYVRMNAVLGNIQTLCSSTTDIANQEQALPVDLFPNPFTDHLQISISDAGSSECVVSWYYITGVLAEQSTHTLEAGKLRLKTDQLRAGMYILQVKYGANENLYFKVLKM